MVLRCRVEKVLEIFFGIRLMVRGNGCWVLQVVKLKTFIEGTPKFPGFFRGFKVPKSLIGGKAKILRKF